MVKLCKDCVYYLPNHIGPDCISPSNGTRLTDGEVQRTWAINSRDSASKCGRSANWFVPKYKAREDDTRKINFFGKIGKFFLGYSNGSD